eukprot:427193-Rhodomonas_salina.2
MSEHDVMLLPCRTCAVLTYTPRYPSLSGLIEGGWWLSARRAAQVRVLLHGEIKSNQPQAPYDVYWKRGLSFDDDIDGAQESDWGSQEADTEGRKRLTVALKGARAPETWQRLIGGCKRLELKGASVWTIAASRNDGCKRLTTKGATR